MTRPDAERLKPVGWNPLNFTERRRNFAIFSGASAISQTGSMSVAAAGPLLALAITGSPIAAGCVTAASVLPALLLQLPAGALVDRMDRRKVMWASQLVRMVSAVLAFACLAFSCDSVIVLIVAALIDGSCSVFYEVAEIAAVPDLVSKKSLNLAIGSNEAKQNASMLFGRPLGGALLAVAPMMPWLVAAGTSFVSLLALLVIGRPRRSAVPGSRKVGHRMAERSRRSRGAAARTGAGGDAKVAGLPLRGVLDRLMRDAFSRTVLVVCILANFLFQVIVLLQIFLAEERGMPSYLVGILLACSGLGGFVGAVGSPLLLRKPPSVSVVLCVLAWVPLAWIIALKNDPVIGLPVWGVCSVIGAHINVALRAHQANTFPSELLGRVTGITRFLSVGAVGLGALSGGWLIHLLGARGAALFIGMAFTSLAIILLSLLPFAAIHKFLLFVVAIIRSGKRDVAARAQAAQEPDVGPTAEPEGWSEGRHAPAAHGSAPGGTAADAARASEAAPDIALNVS
ncbi:MFS transporter [Actinomadura sp. GC306]|uniref:MFS transporter n=1 Tax=Actinomadura sp. GC306 TaxID=2530367 RepID=UPI001404E78B|nr:MFS transporter [Actinomadura sp. GC306]